MIGDGYIIGMSTILRFLNQAHAGHRPAYAWFLRIASFRKCLYVCVYVHLRVCVAPEAINN